jgi:hypothetical protein
MGIDPNRLFEHTSLGSTDVLIFNFSFNVGFGTQKRPQALALDPKSGLPFIRQPRQRTTKITSFLYQAPSKSLFVEYFALTDPAFRSWLSHPLALN